MRLSPTLPLVLLAAGCAPATPMDAIDASPAATQSSAFHAGAPMVRATTHAPESPRSSARYATGPVDVHLSPSPSAAVTNTLGRQDRVEVYEVVAGWGRISRYYDGSVEGIPAQVARWVPMSALAESRPADLPQSRTPADPRIQGIPGVGDGGLTARDVRILHAAAAYYLETGEAQRIEYGDRSASRADTYYLNFGGATNRFFRPSDIPDLEARLQRLGD